MRHLIKGLVVLGLASTVASAQDMKETVRQLGVAAGKIYVAPIVAGYSANFNAGWVRQAPPAKKLGIDVGLTAVVMGAFVKDAPQTLAVSTTLRLDSTQARKVAGDVDTAGMFGQGQRLQDSVYAALRRTDILVGFEGPTLIGDEDMPMTYEVAPDPFTVGTPGGDTTIVLPATLDTLKNEEGEAQKFALLHQFTKYPLPMFAPQFTIGTLYGTNLTVRYLPEYTDSRIGTIKFSGFGIQHNPAVWLPGKLPVDLGVGFFTQTLEVGSLMKASSQAYSLNVSKTFGWSLLSVTPYGGFMLENSTFDFSYEVEDEGEVEEIAFTLEGDNKYRATAGVSFRLAVVSLNADYNFGKYNSASVGVSVGI